MRGGKQQRAEQQQNKNCRKEDPRDLKRVVPSADAEADPEGFSARVDEVVGIDRDMLAVDALRRRKPREKMHAVRARLVNERLRERFARVQYLQPAPQV
eukprot:1433088-Rhodomonas_salina.1